MAKFGITKSDGIKIIGFLDIRPDENAIYIEVDGKTYDLIQLIADYDGEVINVACSKESLPEYLEESEEDIEEYSEE